MDLKNLRSFRAELVALGGSVAATVAMISDQQLLAIITSVPGIMAIYGSYIKGAVSKEELVEAVAKELKN